MGVWGGIKGAYYLVDLALDLAEIIELTNLSSQDLAFKIGQIFGKAIRIFLSLLTGKRR